MPVAQAVRAELDTLARPIEVVDFWTGEGPGAWYEQNEDLDTRIRDRFQETWERISKADYESNALRPWFDTPVTVLGLIILLDQFPRNMFRGEARAFSSDARARKVAKKAVDKDWDMKIGGDLQQFFYVPLMHSECLEDQDRAVRLFMMRMDRAGGNLLHARAHREIIRRFGRFPFRNEAMGRNTTAAEARFLEEGGYGSILRELQPD